MKAQGDQINRSASPVPPPLYDFDFAKAQSRAEVRAEYHVPADEAVRQAKELKSEIKRRRRLARELPPNLRPTGRINMPRSVRRQLAGAAGRGSWHSPNLNSRDPAGAGLGIFSRHPLMLGTSPGIAMYRAGNLLLLSPPERPEQVYRVVLTPGSAEPRQATQPADAPSASQARADDSVETEDHCEPEQISGRAPWPLIASVALGWVACVCLLLANAPPPLPAIAIALEAGLAFRLIKSGH